MSSLRRILSSRANGARSRGPVTPEGKARSRLNALKHGLSSALAAVPPSRSREFNRLYQGLRSDLRPATPAEDSVVRRLAAAVTAAVRTGTKGRGKAERGTTLSTSASHAPRATKAM